MQGDLRRDDRVLPTTRWTLWVVTPILVTAGVILFGFPDRTERLWAWPIGSEMTAMAIGAGYLSGAAFFLVAATRVQRFSRIAVGLAGAAVLTTLLLVATLLHWSLFTHDHVSFWAWTLVYAITPVWLPWLLVTNGRTAPPPTASEPGPVVPGSIRAVVGGAGAVQLGVSGVLFVRPSVLVPSWPWPLTPLTARTVAAFLAFIAVVWLAYWFEARWSALELPTLGASVGLWLVAVAALRGREEFAALPDPSTVVFVGALGGALAGSTALLVVMRRTRPAGDEATEALIERVTADRERSLR